MPELEIVRNSTNFADTSKSIDLQNFDLLQNYSLLINRLEQLALGVDSALSNISVDHREVEIALGGGSDVSVGVGPGTGGATGSGGAGGAGVDIVHLFSDVEPMSVNRAGPTHITHGHGLDEVEYSRVVSDIWIGVVLTLLIVSVIFFICACFLYHKFQQWKNSYRTNANEPVEICRHYPTEYEVESLPSYTIVSGLPSYDDALEEFRKAGIILTSPASPIIKIFESHTKETRDPYNLESGLQDAVSSDDASVSSASTCICGMATTNATTSTTISNNNNNNNDSNNNNNNINNSNASLNATPSNTLRAALSSSSTTNGTQFIELSPEQLAQLSQKRLSLQIAFNSYSASLGRNARPRPDMRNQLLRSRAVSNITGCDNLPQIHRSTSTFSLSNERTVPPQRCLQHRGSLF